MVVETLVGSLLGGVFRIAPEVLKWLDRKNERAHELNMLNAEMEFTKLKGDIALGVAEVQLTGQELDAMAVALKEQGQTARKAGKVMAFISASVRPVVTYWFVALYSAVKIATMSLAFEQGADWRAVLISSWSKDDMAMLGLTLTFWFVGRCWSDKIKRS